MSIVMFEKEFRGKPTMIILDFPVETKKCNWNHPKNTYNGNPITYETAWGYENNTFYFSCLGIPHPSCFKIRKFQIEEKKMKKQFNNIMEFLCVLSQNEYGSVYEMCNKESVGIFYEDEKAKALCIFALVNKNKMVFEKGMKKLQEENLKLMDYFEEKNIDGDLYDKTGFVTINRPFCNGEEVEYYDREDKGETYKQFADSCMEVHNMLKNLNELANKIGWWD